MGREKRGKQTLRKKMMVVMLISTMSSILAVVIVSYMTIRMIRNDSIQESMQIYLEQITRETDSAYYDMISIVNQMSPSGLIGNVVESYLSAEDNFDKYTGQKSLREELVKLGYVNTKLLGVTYYDLEEQSELIRNINVRNLDQVYQTIPNVTENIGNTIQAMHSSCLGIRERPVISVKRRVSFSNRQKLDIYAEIEPDMSVAERLNKENWKYTYMERVYEELEDRFPDIFFVRCYMDPIMQKHGLTPDQKLRKAIYDGLKVREENPKAVTILGSDFALDETSDIRRLLKWKHIEVKESVISSGKL